MKCSHCGKENGEGNGFCIYCGAPLQKPDGNEAEQNPGDGRKKSKTILILPLAAAVIVVVIGVLIFISNKKENSRVQDSYEQAVSDMEDGRYWDAYQLFAENSDYKDSQEKMAECELSYCKEADVGDTVFYGRYEQDSELSNGSESIDWIVLAKQDGKMLLLSKKILACQAYNESGEIVSWADCSLRTWMNGEFLDQTFSEAEKKNLESTKIYDKAGKESESYVFAPSKEELNGAFLSEDDDAEVTEYARLEGAHYTDNWWVRDETDGVGGDRSGYKIGVRTAVWIRIGEREASAEPTTVQSPGTTETAAVETEAVTEAATEATVAETIAFNTAMIKEYANVFEFLASCREEFHNSGELTEALDAIVYRKFWYDTSYPQLDDEYNLYFVIPEEDVQSYVKNLFGTTFQADNEKFYSQADEYSIGVGILDQGDSYIVGGADPCDTRSYYFSDWWESGDGEYDVQVNVQESDYTTNEAFVFHIVPANTTYGFIVTDSTRIDL